MMINDEMRSAFLSALTTYEKGSPMHKFIIRCYVRILKLDNTPTIQLCDIIKVGVETNIDLICVQAKMQAPLPRYPLGGINEVA